MRSGAPTARRWRLADSCHDRDDRHAGGTPERPAIFFSGPEEFRAWLEASHDTGTELWMGLHKKHVPDRALTWEQAVPQALCFGWIDSASQRIDDDARRHRRVGCITRRMYYGRRSTCD
ncbi:YdeI/OmpD-associated family protein [Agromyces bauzanensis]|uniref:Bacteriocin-protection protein n=1 Tax=Agromyces bauzanensis TaxID=1308924 RepID=A0A917PRK9_9MICO|nr:hypothetical protein [Agromyces bauzanensis]GGJ89192.1 hypothetical protein GCM10011372_29780 [Agromyces bauzanensis]